MSALGLKDLMLSLLLALGLSSCVFLFVLPTADSRESLDPATRQLLAAAGERSLTESDPARFLEVCQVLRAGSEAIETMRFVSSFGEELWRIPEDAELDSSAALLKIRLQGGAVLELRAAPRSFLDGLPVLPILVSSLVAFALFWLWATLRVKKPLEALRVGLPLLAREQGVRARTVIEGLRLPALRDLGEDMHRLASSFREEARSSRANFLALELAFEQLHAVLHSLGEGVVVVDMEDELILSNPIANEALELTPLSKGTPILGYFPEKERARIESAIVEARLSGNSRAVPDLAIRGRIYDLSIAPIRENPSVRSSGISEEFGRGVAIVFVDMTQVHELNRMKDDFLSSVSHELRTPLTSIRSFAEILLLMTPDDQDTWQEFLGIMNTEAERLSRLVDEILDLARMEAGKMEMHIATLDLEQILSNVRQIFASITKDKKATLRIEAMSGLPPVEADRDRLHQVIVNLVGNACKFVDEGGQILIRATPSAVNDALVEVSVEDNGPGIPKEDRERVFEKFQQVGDTLTDKPRGTGLGLPLCRQMLTAMGGEIRCVASERLGGAAFLFTLHAGKEALKQW